MRLGVHVPIAGGIPESIPRAEALRCSAMQIFSRSPRGGPAPEITDDIRKAFQDGCRRLDIAPVAVHAPYIVNLASPEDNMWAQSLRLYQDEYARVARLGAQYLVTHVGSTRGAEDSVGVARVAEALNRVLASVSSPSMILVENTAGSGQGLGSQFEQLKAIREGVREPARVGFCLDTAHLFAAGYPIHTPEGLEETVAAFDRLLGLQHLKLFHLNDSKVPFGAKVDRHWHIGYGHIGLEAFRRIVNHPKLRETPFVLETPKESEAEDLHNLATVRALSESPDIPARLPARDPTFSMEAAAPAAKPAKRAAASPKAPARRPRKA